MMLVSLALFWKSTSKRSKRARGSKQESAEICTHAVREMLALKRFPQRHTSFFSYPTTLSNRYVFRDNAIYVYWQCKAMLGDLTFSYGLAPLALHFYNLYFYQNKIIERILIS